MPTVTRTGTSTQKQEAGGSTGAGASQDQTQGQAPSPPPPPNMEMAQLLQAFREECQANIAALQMIAQAVNRQPAGNGNGRSMLAEFKKHVPPTFIETAESLDADDWVRTIEDLLELVGCTEDRERVAYATQCLRGTARAWWDGFKAMHAEQNITWNDFKAEFRKAHIPSRIMAIKKCEF